MTIHQIRVEFPLTAEAVIDVEAETQEEAVAIVRSGRPDIVANVRTCLGKALSLETIAKLLAMKGTTK